MKIKKILFTLAMILGLSSCGVNGTGIGNSSSDVGGNPSSSECTDGVCGGDVELNLDVINEYFDGLEDRRASSVIAKIPLQMMSTRTIEKSISQEESMATLTSKCVLFLLYMRRMRFDVCKY